MKKNFDLPRRLCYFFYKKLAEKNEKQKLPDEQKLAEINKIEKNVKFFALCGKCDIVIHFVCKSGCKVISL